MNTFISVNETVEQTIVSVSESAEHIAVSVAENQGLILQGKDAYQVAVDNGFLGTRDAWLASLQGEQGIQGPPGEADGLDLVDNTSDADKPVSTAQGIAIASALTAANDYTDALGATIPPRTSAVIVTSSATVIVEKPDLTEAHHVDITLTGLATSRTVEFYSNRWDEGTMITLMIRFPTSPVISLTVTAGNSDTVVSDSSGDPCFVTARYFNGALRINSVLYPALS